MATPGGASTDKQELAELLHAVGQGSTDAFDALVHATRLWAVAHACTLLRDRPRAEECVQQAFLEVWQTAARYDRTRGSARGWILSLLRHRALDEIRSSESERRRLARFELLEQRDSSGADSTSEAALARLDGDVVHSALRCLRPDELELIRLSYWSGLSHSQIAAATGVPIGTVKSRTRRALQNLRRAVTETSPDP